MKLKASTGRKLRYGSTSIALTALIVAAVIMVNVIATLLVSKFSFYLDLTPEPHFTLSDEFLALIGFEDEDEEYLSPIEMIDKFRDENKQYNKAHGLTPNSL